MYSKPRVVRKRPEIRLRYITIHQPMIVVKSMLVLYLATADTSTVHLQVCRLVVTEIVLRTNIQERVNCIEKWTTIADILHRMHNYNGVLQICAAFVNSSIYRLSKTWELLAKQTKQTISKLQMIVSSDGRFKNMREALHK